MGWSKRELIQEAFGEMGLPNVSPDELEGALRRLDVMMATWNAKGIRLGYALPSEVSASDIDDMSGLPDSALETVMCSLAVRLAPSYGKTVTVETKATAKAGYDTLLARAAMPAEMQVPGNLPLGAGYKSHRNPFTSAPVEPLLAGPDGDIEFT